MSISENLKLLTGNEAIARGAYEAGVKFASAYPGTPSTEILENIAKYSGIYCQWSVNEKVAMEAGSGASMAGVRTLVAMKHVGLNVAADPFMTLTYTGVGAGFVVISADDPHMHSSQMTGHQVNPGVGKTLMGDDAVEIKPEAIARAVGIKHVRVVDSYNLKKLEIILREELERNELSVVVCRRICALLEKKNDIETVYIDQHTCKQCGVCMKFGCPAIELRDGFHVINRSLCTGCEVCVGVCKYKAINSIKR